MPTKPTAWQAASSLVADRFPQASVALLTGSAARGVATATSDLDIVVVLSGSPAPYRETLRHGGWLVELFVHTEQSLHGFYERERAEGRCTLAHMVATGEALVAAEAALLLAADAEEMIEQGPPALSVAEADKRRYLITADLDDLVDATDSEERVWIASHLVTSAADLALRVSGQWSGRGKWLFRNLQQWDASVATSLTEVYQRVVAQGEIDDLVAQVGSLLDLAGGPLAEGYTATARADREPDG
jgi:predicted nucleotidyltransferase